MHRTRPFRLGCCSSFSAALATTAASQNLGWDGLRDPGPSPWALLSPKLSPQHHRVMSPGSRRYLTVCSAALALVSPSAPASVPQWVSELRNQTSAHKALEEQREEKQNPISLFLKERGGRKPWCWLHCQQHKHQT